MILAGIVYAAFTGNLPAVTDAALDAAQQAVTLCITMAGVLAFWVGLMRIAENAGMMQRAADRIYPLLHFLFPRIPREHAACKSIAANCIANFFGLGWAATPAGLLRCLPPAKIPACFRRARGFAVASGTKSIRRRASFPVRSASQIFQYFV